jgi:hypothetical protein
MVGRLTASAARGVFPLAAPGLAELRGVGCGGRVRELDTRPVRVEACPARSLLLLR